MRFAPTDDRAAPYPEDGTADRSPQLRGAGRRPPSGARGLPDGGRTVSRRIPAALLTNSPPMPHQYPPPRSAGGASPRPRPGLVLQERDERLLQSLDCLHFLRAEHLHALHFRRVSRRVAQGRLQRLHEHGLVDRYYLPVVLDRLRPSSLAAREPVYALSSGGGRLLAERGLAPWTKQRSRFRHIEIARSTLEHHLVVSEFLVALQIAFQEGGRPEGLDVEAEHWLWRKLHAFKGALPPRPLIVPDGAASIDQDGGQRLTLYLEVVRADVRSGIWSLHSKLERYVRLQRSGYFASVFGHPRLRAVLFLAPTAARAVHLAALTRDMAHGRRLFWFGSYAERGPGGRISCTLTKETILDRRWVDGAGEAHSLREAFLGAPLGVPPKGGSP